MSDVSVSVLGCVTVTFHPDVDVLRRQIDALPVNAIKVIIDNGSTAEEWAAVKKSLSGHPSMVFLGLTQNVGLAAATNIGVETLASTYFATHVLLLDQDSIPEAGAVDRLHRSFIELEMSGAPIGAVGPALIDPRTGISHGFHQIKGWRWIRVHGAGEEILPCAGLNGSGTLMKTSDFLLIGGLREDFFIDHVDTEWSFRLQAQGYRIYGIPGAIFKHQMGDAVRRLWLMGWRAWPVRTPTRHRYLFRNAVTLLRATYVPWVWKVWALPKLGLSMLVFGFTGPNRVAQLLGMLKGVVDGILRKQGPLD